MEIYQKAKRYLIGESTVTPLSFLANASEDNFVRLTLLA